MFWRRIFNLLFQNVNVLNKKIWNKKFSLYSKFKVAATAWFPDCCYHYYPFLSTVTNLSFRVLSLISVGVTCNLFLLNSSVSPLLRMNIIDMLVDFFQPKKKTIASDQITISYFTKLPRELIAHIISYIGWIPSCDYFVTLL